MSANFLFSWLKLIVWGQSEPHSGDYYTTVIGGILANMSYKLQCTFRSCVRCYRHYRAIPTASNKKLLKFRRFWKKLKNEVCVSFFFVAAVGLRGEALSYPQSREQWQLCHRKYIASVWRYALGVCLRPCLNLHGRLYTSDIDSPGTHERVSGIHQRLIYAMAGRFVQILRYEVKVVSVGIVWRSACPGMRCFVCDTIEMTQNIQENTQEARFRCRKVRNLRNFSKNHTRDIILWLVC
jgi:hypothetical protein